MTRLMKTKAIDQAIEEYDREGATVLREVVSPEWIVRLSAAIDTLMDSGASGFELSRAGEGRFFGDVFSWLHEPEFKAFILESGLAEVAGKIMRTPNVRFFYDQLLVKEPNTAKRTPWHQDLPYWPVTSEQVVSIWVPIDAASPENGVVTYVRGSHRWNVFFPMETWGDNAPRHAEQQAKEDDDGSVPSRSIADIGDHPEKYDFITWTVEPGDVIIHHPLTVHGAPGNLSSIKRRRALSLRWCGEDARWDDTRLNFMQRLKETSSFPYPKLTVGEELNDPLFPVIWSQG